MKRKEKEWKEKEVSATNCYVLKDHIKTRLENRGLVYQCERCGEPIKVGDEIASKTFEGKTKRFFHKRCWNKMFM